MHGRGGEADVNRVTLFPALFSFPSTSEHRPAMAVTNFDVCAWQAWPHSTLTHSHTRARTHARTHTHTHAHMNASSYTLSIAKHTHILCPAHTNSGTAEPTRLRRRKHVCEVCGKSFNQSGNLSRHRAVHSKARPFKCPTCGKGFAQKSHVKTHMTVHDG